ncbi:glucosamine-6-phosphate deaminase [uncultured Limosilactobacillus sp.]|uniref:glucosamine-6-phosphate deaminase n=1 Tax=uncultured Limosilactobacillus sp. TaxID=2837629 RepID=UPI0025F6FF86|nr:glucosamine-6-phosphate deaminase [uncultured Limosilactobacillus sp.]
MNVIVVKNATEGGKQGAAIFQTARQSGATTFGLATGSTPLTTYAELCASSIDFQNCISINLDEYVGLGRDDEQSYAYFMQKHLFTEKPFAHSYIPNGLATDLKKEVQRYDQVIAEHPIDLQILGIGRNGHIGFNEPGTSFDSTTHEVQLTQSTIDANSRFFNHKGDVPRAALSMGMASIMQAKQILLEAYGDKKASAVAKMIEGPVTEDVPASILQRHPNVTIIIDEAAAQQLHGQY